MALDANEHFKRYFEGDWKRRWWFPGPKMVRIKTYSSGEISRGIVAVHGVADDGTRISFTGLDSGDTGLTGYRRVTERTLHGQPSDA